MADKRHHTGAELSHSAPPAFSWSQELAVCICLVLAIVSARLLVGWYNGRGIQPLATVGVVLYISTFLALGARRRWKAAHQGSQGPTRWRLSLAELFMILTGLICYLGFTAAEYHQSRRIYRERKEISALAQPILGPDGSFSFDSRGNISVTVCDRTFDDARLAELAAFIRERDFGAEVQWLIFGTGAKTAGTPARWPGVTDRSVPLIQQWKGLQWLSIEGTAITSAARQRLINLPALQETSRSSLQR